MTANEQLAGLRERVEAVRALHRRVDVADTMNQLVNWPSAAHWNHCHECGFNAEWPCPTIKALDGQSC